MEGGSATVQGRQRGTEGMGGVAEPAAVGRQSEGGAEEAPESARQYLGTNNMDVHAYGSRYYGGSSGHFTSFEQVMFNGKAIRTSRGQMPVILPLLKAQKSSITTW